MSTSDAGSNAWKMTSNHNKMIDLQSDTSTPDHGQVTIAYYGGSAFCITSPKGVSIMIDPWRNHPSGSFDWYFHDFPMTKVDIGVNTHAHFDHDALHRLDCHVALERLIGNYSFSDVVIQGIADKHATDCSCGFYDYNRVLREIGGVDIEPPDNPRSWDNCLIVAEVAGLRILHWGDNRGDPREEAWESLGRIDIALLPIDDSQHVLGFGAVDAIIERLQPKVIIPHHYYIWDVVQRHSTLLPPEKWLASRDKVVRVDGARMTYAQASLGSTQGEVHYFGENVMFDKAAWLRGESPVNAG